MEKQNWEKFWESRFGGDTDKTVFNQWLIQNQTSREQIISFVESINTTNVLDVACGIGLDYMEYKKRNIDIDYTGIDITETFVKNLSEQFPEATFVHGTANDLPFEDGSFEIVTSRHLLEHTPDPEPILREMARVSKRYVVNGWFRLTPNETVISLKNRKGGQFYQNDYNRDEMKALVNNIGLNIIRVDRYKHNENWIMEKE